MPQKIHKYGFAHASGPRSGCRHPRFLGPPVLSSGARNSLNIWNYRYCHACPTFTGVLKGSRDSTRDRTCGSGSEGGQKSVTGPKFGLKCGQNWPILGHMVGSLPAISRQPEACIKVSNLFWNCIKESNLFLLLFCPMHASKKPQIWFSGGSVAPAGFHLGENPEDWRNFWGPFIAQNLLDPGLNPWCCSSCS